LHWENDSETGGPCKLQADFPVIANNAIKARPARMIKLAFDKLKSEGMKSIMVAVPFALLAAMVLLAQGGGAAGAGGDGAAGARVTGGAKPGMAPSQPNPNLPNQPNPIPPNQPNPIPPNEPNPNPTYPTPPNPTIPNQPSPNPSNPNYPNQPGTGTNSIARP